MKLPFPRGKADRLCCLHQDSTHRGRDLRSRSRCRRLVEKPEPPQREAPVAVKPVRRCQKPGRPWWKPQPRPVKIVIDDGSCWTQGRPARRFQKTTEVAWSTPARESMDEESTVCSPAGSTWLACVHGRAAGSVYNGEHAGGGSVTLRRHLFEAAGATAVRGLRRSSLETHAPIGMLHQHAYQRR